MGLAFYNAQEIAERHDEIQSALRHQPAWCLRDGLIKEWLKALPKDAKITDLGSGIGEMERQIFGMGFTNVTSVDIDEYIDRGLIGGNPHFVKANLSTDRIDIPDESQDVVLATQVFEHLENPWHCAREMVRMCKPGGLIIVSIPDALSFANRVKYFFTGEIDSYGITNNHISTFTKSTFALLWRGKTEVIRRDYGEGFIRIPFTGRKLRFSGKSLLGKWFTRKTAYVMRKK